jgi:hypothetical protein
VRVCVLMKGVGSVKGYGKGGSWRRLGGEAAETEWLGDGMHGTSAHGMAGNLQR